MAVNFLLHIDWLGFVLASVAVVLAPGPGSMFVARTAGARGRRAGRMAMFGIMLGDSCLIALSLLGVSALLQANPLLFHVIRLAGAGYLIYLGLQALFFSGAAKEGVAETNIALSLRQSFIITLLNPKAVFFFMAFFPLFIRSAASGLLLPYLALSMVFMLISFLYLRLLIVTSARLGTAFRASHRVQSWARRITGTLFLGYGIKVALASK